MEKINSKLKALERSQNFSHYKPMGIFFRYSKAGNSQVPDRILPNFKPIRDLMGVLVACKNKEDPIKNEGANVVTTLFIDFSDVQGQLTPKSVTESCRNSIPSKLFMVDLVTCKNEEDSLENDTTVVTTFLPLIVYGDFSKRSRAANSQVLRRILSNFELIQDFMVVLITYKNKKEPIKNEGARVVSRFSPL